jgi:hypothetical protein
MPACKIPPTVQGTADLSLLDESSHVTMVAGVIAAGTSPLPAEPLSPVHHTSDAAEVDPELLSGDGLEALPSSHMTDMSASHTRAPDAVAPACATVAAAATATVPTLTFVNDFISSISSNLSTPILTLLLRLKVSQVPDYSVVPRRSTRLADKPKASNPEVQGTNVILKKLGRDVSLPTLEDSGACRFRETFFSPCHHPRKRP